MTAPDDLTEALIQGTLGIEKHGVAVAEPKRPSIPMHAETACSFNRLAARMSEPDRELNRMLARMFPGRRRGIRAGLDEMEARAAERIRRAEFREEWHQMRNAPIRPNQTVMSQEVFDLLREVAWNGVNLWPDILPPATDPRFPLLTEDPETGAMVPRRRVDRSR